MTKRIFSAVKIKAFTLNSNRNTLATKLSKRNCPRDSKNMSEVLEIDGGMMEGGGQILRISMALSALLKKPIRIFNIRAGRSSPGLRPQHLAGVKLVGEITQGRLKGAEVGSTEVTFHPGPITSGGNYEAKPGTAGSVMLLFQVSYPCLLFAEHPSELSLHGGTNADMAPQIDHTLMVFKPILERLGARFSCEIVKRGYFPKGGGKVVIKLEPVASHLQPIELLDPGSVTKIEGRSYVAGVLPIKMAHSMADAASRSLRGRFLGIPVDIMRQMEPAHLAVGNGAGIVMVAKTSTGCLLGGSSIKKIRDGTTEDVGVSAAKEIIDEVDKEACVDAYVQDQLIIFMALAKGKSRVRIGTPTLHTMTAIYVVEMMTKAKFTLCPDETGKATIMECDGIGLER